MGVTTYHIAFLIVQIHHVGLYVLLPHMKINNCTCRSQPMKNTMSNKMESSRLASKGYWVGLVWLFRCPMYYTVVGHTTVVYSHLSKRLE